MKSLAVTAFLALLVIAFSAFKALESTASDTLKRLGIPGEIANDCIWSSFSGGYLSTPTMAKLKQTPVAERRGIVQEIGEYAKAYTRSEDFKKKYLEHREGQKPKEPEPPKSMAEQRKEQKEQMQKSIAETETNMKSMSSDQKKTMQGVLDMFKQQLKSIDDPKNPMFSPDMEKMLNQSHAAQMEEHKKKLNKWEKEYPATPNEMIKRWLTQFLDVSKDVDFNAKLIAGEGGTKSFANKEYERKPDSWKMCFRAGKETVDAGRSFAKQWLEELSKTK